MMMFLLPLAVIGAYLFKKQQDAMTLPPGQPTQPTEGDPSMAMFVPEQEPMFVADEQPIGRAPLLIQAKPPLSQRLAGGQTSMPQTAISKLLKPRIMTVAKASGGMTIQKAPVRIK